MPPLSNSAMPALAPEMLAAALTREELALVLAGVNPQTGALRATKPPIRTTEGYFAMGTPRKISRPEDVAAAILWRWLCYELSPRPVHRCTPSNEETLRGLDLTDEQRHTLIWEVYRLVQKILALVPPERRNQHPELPSPWEREGG